MLTHGNLLANAWTAIAWAHLSEEDRWLVMAPMFHAAGTCLLWASGHHQVWSNARTASFSGTALSGTARLADCGGGTRAEHDCTGDEC